MNEQMFFPIFPHDGKKEWFILALSKLTVRTTDIFGRLSVLLPLTKSLTLTTIATWLLTFKTTGVLPGLEESPRFAQPLESYCSAPRLATCIGINGTDPLFPHWFSGSTQGRLITLSKRIGWGLRKDQSPYSCFSCCWGTLRLALYKLSTNLYVGFHILLKK